MCVRGLRVATSIALPCLLRAVCVLARNSIHHTENASVCLHLCILASIYTHTSTYTLCWCPCLSVSVCTCFYLLCLSVSVSTFYSFVYVRMLRLPVALCPCA